MKISIYYKGFLIFSGLVLIFNLLLMNDFLSVLGGVEANNILAAQENLEREASNSESSFRLPMSMLINNYNEVGFNLFLLRLPNVLLLFLGMLGFFGLGNKLFGRSTMFLTLLVLSSTFLVIPTTKFVAFDVWLLTFQMMSFTSLILLLKQPVLKWRVLFWISTILTVLIEPQSAMVFTLGISLFMIFAHPNGKKAISFIDVLFWVGIFVLAFFNGGIYNEGSGFFFHYDQITPKNYAFYHFLGVLPWIAFLPAAFVDLFQKLRRREEMAIILFSFLLFSILSCGLILQVAFALLIAKQLENYFKPNYPYVNLVKTIAVLNLGFSFFIVAVLLLTGYDTFGEIGFRSRMGVGGVYWAFSFLSVIGLFGKNKKMIVGSMTLCGALTMLLFWTQLVPKLEIYRNLPEKMTTAVEKIDQDRDLEIYIIPSVFLTINNSERIGVYFNSKKIDYQIISEGDSLRNKSGVFILDQLTFSSLDSTWVENIEKIPVEGRNGIFEEEEKIWILKK